MVGLSVVLESQKGGVSSNNKTTTTTQVINKTTMMLTNTNKLSHSPFQEPTTFLELCFLCRKKLLPGKDIYMYKGDKAFCSVECRCNQIFMDEEEAIQKENCSFAAMRPSSSSSSSSTHHHKKGARKQTGGFSYS